MYAREIKLPSKRNVLFKIRFMNIITKWFENVAIFTRLLYTGIEFVDCSLKLVPLEESR